MRNTGLSLVASNPMDDVGAGVTKRRRAANMA